MKRMKTGLLTTYNMRSINAILIVVICLITTPIFSAPKAVCLTIPKSGTHLAKKCFALIKQHRPEAEVPHCTHFHLYHRQPKCMDPIVIPIVIPIAEARNQSTRIIFLLET